LEAGKTSRVESVLHLETTRAFLRVPIVGEEITILHERYAAPVELVTWSVNGHPTVHLLPDQALTSSNERLRGALVASGWTISPVLLIGK
jgi:hypothetical protein